MPSWLVNILITAATLVVTLTITFLFNKLVALPKELKKQRDAEAAAQAAREEEAAAKEAKLQRENQDRDRKINLLETAVASLPGYREQSLQIQQQLQSADTTILATCQQIQAVVAENQRVLNARLDRLEKREKNAIREKLLNEYRLMTSNILNPSKCWSEMEHHAFFELVRDYEDLGGNDYVHSIVIPEVNELMVIPMTDTVALKRMYDLRNSAKLIGAQN
jgi:hypothetical protein